MADSLAGREQALADRVRRRRLLALTTADGRIVYPARQFDGSRLVAGLADTLRAFRTVPADGWSVAAWLTTPAAALGGTSPLDWLIAHRDPGVVQDLALDTAARWTV